jgi:hypothetical protein
MSEIGLKFVLISDSKFLRRLPGPDRNVHVKSMDVSTSAFVSLAFMFIVMNHVHGRGH